MKRITKQKTAILEYLKSVKTHPSAEEIFNNIKKNLPQVSLATVYRNLKEFKNKNLVLEILGEPNRYDGNTDEHYHFICEKCQNIYDLMLKIKLKNDFKNIGLVKSRQFYFYGICKKCL